MKITKVSLLVVAAGTYARIIDSAAGVEANVLLPNGTKDPVQDLIYLAETELIKATVATRRAERLRAAAAVYARTQKR